MARDRASRPEATPLRLFVAIDVPHAVRDELADELASVRPSVKGARWVPPENWHVTLAFLGRTWPRLVTWVQERLGACTEAAAPVATRLDGVGAFPSWRRARVVWTGLEDPDDALAAIAGSVRDALAREFPPEARAFTPHLTLARLRPPAPVEPGALAGVRPSRAFAIEELVLYRSHLRRPAPVYEPLARFPLGGVGPGG